jgi:hypothetical protein
MSGVRELAFRCTLSAGEDNFFEIQALIKDEKGESPAPQRVALSNWGAGDQHAWVELGEQLIPSGRVRERFMRLVRDARETGELIRLLIELPQPTDRDGGNWDKMVKVPWERAELRLVERGGPVPLAWSLEPRISIVRAIAEPLSEVKVIAPGQSSPATKRRYRHIDVTAASPLDTELEAAPARLDPGRFDVENEDLPAHTAAEDLKATVKRHSADADVLHITGHGEPGGIPIWGQHQVNVSPEDLSESFAGTQAQLLLLSVCESASPKWLKALIPRLHLPAFIGMQHPMLGPANSEFVGRLFESLQRGDSIDEAMWWGRDAARAAGGPVDSWWWVPVLYLSRESRQNPWLWAEPCWETEPSAYASVPAAPQDNHPPLPPAETTFTVNPGSCFIAFPNGMVEVFPGGQGLHARRLPQGDERLWLPARQVTVAVDRTGRRVACAADGEFKFAPVGTTTVLPRDWITARDLTGEVSAVHSLTSRKNGVEATVTLGGKPKRIRVDHGGSCHEKLIDESAIPDSNVADTTDEVAVTLSTDGQGRLIVVEYQGEIQVFRAPEDATGVNVVRGGRRSAREAGIVVRMGSRAQLWSVAALRPMPTRT